MLAVGASARCGEECYIRQLLLVSSASSGLVSLTASAFGLVEVGVRGAVLEDFPASAITTVISRISLLPLIPNVRQ